MKRQNEQSPASRIAQLEKELTANAVELERKNRDLEIESSLERVRAVAMGMNQSDDLLSICETMFHELKKLGFDDLRNAMIDIHYEAKAYLLNYDYSDNAGKTITTFIYNSHPIVDNLIYHAKQSSEAFTEMVYSGKALDEWRIFRKQNGEADDSRLDNIEALYYYFYSIGTGAIGISTFSAANPKQLNVLKRFRNVFDLAYRRYTDIQLAENQAREAQIELALERVRARTMAMQHSDELAETAYILFQQFRELGENPDQATIGIINEAEGVIEYWVTIYGNQTNKVFKFPIDEPNVTCKIYDAWKAQEKSLVIDLSGQALYDFSKFRESMGGAGYNEAEQRRIINVAFFSKGLINVQSTVTRSAESLRLLERFANVFEGTYTRFLDLKKAEAQAREGQIELALERVRARAMAMRDSKELSGMVSTVFSELTKLDFALTRCAIVIADSGSGSWMIWMANSEAGQPPISFYRKSLDHPYPNAANEEWKKRTPKWVYHLKGAEKKGMDDYYANSEEVAHLSSVIKQAMDMPESIILSHSFNNFGYLRADSLEYLSEANLDILYRFAKVFDLGYTRFTDIKQAEAQAREAQIELALERVRAKTMAMQHSDELLETSQVVFQQLRDLGESADQISIAIVKEDEGIFDLFATIYGAQMVQVVHPKIDDHFVMGRVYKNWKAHKKSFVVELGGEELRQYNILRNQLGAVNYYNEDIGPDDRWIVSAASFSKGLLSFSSSTEPTKEAAQLLERFAKVFDSTYTRFLDLQKAEAQARESQIQLALERVRARTMAMQKSDELAETVSLLFKQLLDLGIRQEQIRTCGIVTFDDNEPIGEQWVTETNGEIIQQSFMVPYTEAPAYISIYGSWKKGEKFKVIHLKGELLKQHFRYLDKHANVPIRDVVARRQAKEIYNHVLFFSQGYLFIITKEALPGYHDVFKRFGAVFQQSYTRFLDLKKAEAQAREGQIQLAMERVRARTMAMQHSDELTEASYLLDSQVRALGIKTRGCAFNIYGENESTEWFGLETGPLVYKTPREEAFLLYYEAGQRGESLYINEFAADACKAHYEYLCTLPDVGDALKKMRENGRPFPAYQIDHVVYFKFGYLLFITFGPVPEAHDIFKRFAAVFEQTYTRFLDLKKSELQARESQIELGLERVRARTMAMQKSDELKEIIKVVYEQFVHLNIAVEHAGFIMDYNTRDDMHIWLADKHYAPAEVTVPYFDSPHWNGFNEAKEKGLNFFAIYSTFEEKNKFYQDLFKLIPGVTDETKEYYFSCPGLAISTVLLENVGLYIENFAGIPYTDDENGTLMRFGRVFQQTYTRFLDLQKAEAQAREGQIEAALERVRSRTMSMHNSQDVGETITTLFDELTRLGFATLRCSIDILNDTSMMEIWTAKAGKNEKADLVIGHLDTAIHPMLRAMYNAWKAKKPDFFYELAGDDQTRYLTALNEYTGYPINYEIASMPAKQFLNAFFFADGGILAWTAEPLHAEAPLILTRFASVFGQTYRRYLDLQKAEAQAREGQIQLALERVRARTMAMQKSEELAETASVLFQQLLDLGISSERTFIGMPNDDTRKIELWGTEQGGNQMSMRFEYEADATYAFREIYKAWQEKRSELTVILKGKNLDEHVNYVRNVLHMPLLIGLVQKQRILYNAFFSKGLLMIVTPDAQSKETLEILERFAGVFDGTYTRFLDLQQAEAQAREAKIELGLERVRARAMAMQNSDELADLVATIFSELTKLDFSLTRCAIYIMDENLSSFRAWRANTEIDQAPESFYIKFTSHPFFNAFFKAWKERKLKWVYDIKGIEKQSLDDYFFNETEYSRLPDIVKTGMRQPERVFLSYAFNNFGGLQTSGLEPLSDANLDILSRFGKVFDMTYTRFNDLKQAEAQVREAKIEAALERVRSRTMAMFKSDELAGTSVEVFKQLIGLGIQPNRLFIGIINDDSGDIELWATNEDGTRISTKFTGNVNRNQSVKKMYAGWKAHKRSITIDMQGKELQEYFSYLKDELKVPFKLGLSQKRRVQLITYFSQGFIGMASPEPQPETTTNLLERFAGVFNLTYTRFRDLQKAEAQARDAKIEASLERVRSKTMAMHNSQDVGETVAAMFDELVKLGVETTARLGICIVDDTSHMEVWTASADAQGKTSMRIGRLDMTIHPILQALHTAWKNKQTMFSYPLAGEEMKAYYRAINNSPDYPSQFNLDTLPKQEAHNSFLFAEGAIFIFSLANLSTEITQIFKKFAGVFGQTYRRYLDLQKAEAQAREAKIEASLERVRSKTMAMHNSQDVGDTIAAMFSEFVKLGIETIRCGIGIGDSTNEMEIWTAKSNPDGVATLIIGRLDTMIHPALQGIYRAWKNRESTFEYRMTGDDLKDYYRAINNSNYYPVRFDIDSLPAKQVLTDFFFGDGVVFAFTDEPLADSAIQIFKRFAGVFGQTYRRYLDLQKAETQAREAQIEASLERVRGKALAMYNSKDLSSTASLVFTELRKLGVNSKRCGVALLSKNSRHTQLYVATTTLDTDSLDLIGAIELSGHPSLEKQYESWLKNEDYFTVLKGEELKSYKQLIYSMLPVPYDHSYHEEFGYYLAFSEGFLFSWAERPFSEIEINILNRFKSIIDLTFRRYIELQKSEANAREAIRQSSLDRVRAEIASMRTTGDLDRITPLIWNELTILGVPFIRCGVFIMDEPLQLIHTYLSTPDGKAIAAFQLHFNADNGNGVNGVALQGWRQKQAVTLHWTEEEFRTFSHSLMEQGEIASEEGYLTEHPPSGLDLHFFPFLQGMLYAGNTEPLSDDDKDLVQSLADAFSTAYARYEDFNRLELAKQQVEHTLSDLKSAQTKLVQSEKMASLGELTAGIAHEIQNPLNFVNNFSEVNQEMIEELEEELNAGNIEEALALAADIKQNEQKINHHGKRADGIVKGMLEHSRTGGGEKMPINMNALADEFMRLSYHGLRAKDKAFNAEMVTNFDPDLPKINVIGQDMGRVILNLFNNAFYAVNQKKKTADAAYRPEVSVTTSAENGRVSITVKDNGIGIPDAIKEKIMQPFFTTKPTGEGTGLGLSLTYDMVVKGHGGSIQVNSVEGEGSEFIIQLPIN